MLVSIKLAKLLVNVFWTAKMTIAVKQIASRYSKMNTQNALVILIALMDVKDATTRSASAT